MNKDSSDQFSTENQYYLFNESLIPQGLIVGVKLEDNSLSFLISQTNKAFNLIAKNKPITEPKPVESIFNFLEGFHCQPLKQFYLSDKALVADFIYQSPAETYKLTLKKLQDGSILFALQDISD